MDRQFGYQGDAVLSVPLAPKFASDDTSTFLTTAAMYFLSLPRWQFLCYKRLGSDYCDFLLLIHIY